MQCDAKVGNFLRISKIESFIQVLNKHRENFTILVRWSKGEDINAACGQLAVNS